MTVVEFALIAPVMAMTLLALFDFAHRSYVESIMQGALHEAARMATVGDKTGTEIDAHVNSRLRTFSSNATVVIDKAAYAEFSQFQKPEKITQDTAPVGQYNPGDCFEDSNGNGVYDVDRKKSGLGDAEDVVYYQVTMTYPRLLPLGHFLGFSDTQSIKVSTLLRNQPFAGRTTSKIVC